MPTPHELPAKLIRSQLPYIAEVTADARASGIYFLLDADGALVYVGQSRNVAVRWQQHVRNHVPFAKATWQPMDLRFLDAYEQEYIFEFRPPFNAAHKPRAKRRRKKDLKPVYQSWGWDGARYYRSGAK